MSEQLHVIGVTGRSGSGKSSVARYYETLGYPMEDGDALSRVVCSPGSACVEEIVKAFGPEMVDETGNLQRRKLGEIVYEAPEKNKKLIAITHPYIMEELIRREKTAQEKGAQLFFLDGATIVGSMFEKHCEKIILVESDPKLTVSRIILRDGISKTAAQKRLEAQKVRGDLHAAADYIIENNGSLESLHEKANEVLKAISAAFCLNTKME